MYGMVWYGMVCMYVCMYVCVMMQYHIQQYQISAKYECWGECKTDRTAEIGTTSLVQVHGPKDFF